jgi:hypothetical protein
MQKVDKRARCAVAEHSHIVNAQKRKQSQKNQNENTNTHFDSGNKIILQPIPKNHTRSMCHCEPQKNWQSLSVQNILNYALARSVLALG